MVRRPPRSTRTDTLFPYTTRFRSSLPKAICMILLGLLLGMVGTDVNSGVARFDFGIPELQDGIDFAVVAMGVFGFAEIMTNLELKDQRRSDEHTSELQSLMRSSYAVFCLKKKKRTHRPKY